MVAGSAPPETRGASARGRRGLNRFGLGLAVLTAATLLGHLLLLWRMSAWLDTGLQANAMPQRVQAAFVREIQPVAVAPVAAPAAPPAPKRAAAPTASPPASAASQAELSEAKPERAPQTEPVEPAVASAAAASEPGMAEAAASPSAASASANAGGPPFEWPLGTRLSYTITGWIRGEVSGTAQVEWLREGSRYQMHLDVLVGPSFAPLMQRRMTSEGEIGPQGLAPRRYDERTRIAFGSPREATLHFEPAAPAGPATVLLATGARVPALPGVQDSASQLVQLTYLFATGASPLVAGHRIDLPLALPRRMDRWVYAVIGEEELRTPFGAVRTWHVKPQREGDASALSVEAWFAPALRYLPIRIVIRQGQEDHLDLQVDRLPQEAEEAPPVGGPLPR